MKKACLAFLTVPLLSTATAIPANSDGQTVPAAQDQAAVKPSYESFNIWPLLITAPAPPLNTVNCLSWGNSSNVNMPVNHKSRRPGYKAQVGEKARHALMYAQLLSERQRHRPSPQ